MSPSPEKIEQQHPATEGADTASNPLARGLHLEARLKAPTWEVGLPGILQDFTPGEVILLLDDRVTEHTPVTVQLHTYSFEGEVLYCRPRGSGYEAHVSIDDADFMGLRRAPRFPVSLAARVFVSISDTPVDARIFDISGAGLGIEGPLALPVQASIAVESDENIAFGVVRHCRELSAGRFRAGVELHHIIKKDPDLEKAAAESGWMNKLGARFGLRRKP
jgi:hypothetical protein